MKFIASEKQEKQRQTDALKANQSKISENHRAQENYTSKSSVLIIKPPSTQAL